MDEQQDKPGFRVTDRRRFSDSGDARDGTEQPTPVEQPAPGEAPARDEAGGAAPALEPVTFSTFVLGLSTQALLHLGEIDSPLTGKTERDLGAAKHVIDILGVLREKTRSNLDQGEQQLLDSVLYDLRMRYVELVREPKKKEEA
jgi:hypothetical protein